MQTRICAILSWKMRNNLLLDITLFPFALLYYMLVSVRNFCYDHQMIKSVKMPVPVISIGNLTTGGTGKTPVTLYLAELLKTMKYRPGIISRGYGRNSKGRVVIHDGTRLCIDVNQGGDEPIMMAQRLKNVPVIVSESRVAGINKMIRDFDVDVVIMDDGFQHSRVDRDLDIVLLNSREPVHNYWILPLGRLRERFSGLNR